MKTWREISVYHFGFYSRHPTRQYEYEWILDNITEGRVMDIGAGISPIPIMLQETCDVYTCDPGEPSEFPHNEWGFYDYGQSFNGKFTDFKSRKRFDVIYSISVLEHMPRTERVKTLNHCYKILRKGGLLLLTVDIRHKGVDIWNMNDGKVIEEDHGTIYDLTCEVADAGFATALYQRQRDIPGVAIDILYIKAWKEE